MKIVKVEVIGLRKQLACSMAISRGGFSVRTHTLVRLWTDEGQSGLGEAVGNADYAQDLLQGSLGRSILGQDPTAIERIRHLLMGERVYYERKGSAVAAASALETACWDLFGKALGLPVHALLGGRCHEDLRAYARDIYWEADPSSMARAAERILAQGHTAIKAHLGCAPPREETARLQAIRDAVGPETLFMVDLNAGYDLRAAREAVARWAHLDLHWLEEPLHPDHLDAAADLRAHSPIPIAAGENEYRLHGFQSLFRAGALDVAMPDIARVGGLWETRQVSVLADAWGVPVSPHNFSSGVLLAATRHLLAATPNASMLEMDTSGNAVYGELLLEPAEPRNGRVKIPTAPGLGVELTQATLERHGVARAVLE
jgi:L-alanine-DL-glutamate epimerase-like enolase superfamily enzyme